MSASACGQHSKSEDFLHPVAVRGRIEVRLEDETVWLTQNLIAELFQTTKQNVGQHLKNIFAEGELRQDSVVKKSFTTAAGRIPYRLVGFADSIAWRAHRPETRPRPGP